MSFVASTIHPARRQGAEHAWKAVFALAEQRLAPREWALGRYSIADIHLFRLYWRFHRSRKLVAPRTYPPSCRAITTG